MNHSKELQLELPPSVVGPSEMTRRHRRQKKELPAPLLICMTPRGRAEMLGAAGADQAVMLR